MKIVNETKFIKCYDLKGNVQYVKTIFEKDKTGKIFSRRLALRQKRVA
jgi:hypothetical protein